MRRTLIWLTFVLASSLSKSCLGLSSPILSSIEQRKGSERTVVLLLNKPAGVVTSHVPVDDRPTVYDFITIENFADENPKDTVEETTGIASKLHAIGRLDADTRGLLLLTNDGSLQHHVTNPNAPTHQGSDPVTKTYEALIMGHHTEETLKPLWDGVDIGTKYGGMTKPVHDLKILDYPRHKTTLVSISISEGKNRQVRRMFHALGSGVMELKRLQIGNGLNLEGVQEGQWRILSDEEVQGSLGWTPRVLDKERRIKKKGGSTRSRRSRPSSNPKRGSDTRPRTKRIRS